MWRDEHGKALHDYPRPSLAVDVAVLSVTWDGGVGQLSVLLHRASDGFAQGQWLLPGTFVRENELLAAAAQRALTVKGGVPGCSPRQLAVLDALDRDSRGRVVSVAHVDVLRSLPLGEATALMPVVDGRACPTDQRALPFDHDVIVGRAAAWLQERYARRADPERLLGDRFTLLDLQRLHEAVGGRPLVKDTFRRGFSVHLVATGELAGGTMGRPAELYRHMTREERHEADAQRMDGRSRRRQ